MVVNWFALSLHSKRIPGFESQSHNVACKQIIKLFLWELLAWSGWGSEKLNSCAHLIRNLDILMTMHTIMWMTGIFLCSQYPDCDQPRKGTQNWGTVVPACTLLVVKQKGPILYLFMSWEDSPVCHQGHRQLKPSMSPHEDRLVFCTVIKILQPPSFWKVQLPQ